MVPVDCALWVWEGHGFSAWFVVTVVPFALWPSQQLAEAVEKDNAAALVKRKRRTREKERRGSGGGGGGGGAVGGGGPHLTKSTSFNHGTGGGLLGEEGEDAGGRSPERVLPIATDLATSSIMSTGSALDGDFSAPSSTRLTHKVRWRYPLCCVACAESVGVWVWGVGSPGRQVTTTVMRSVTWRPVSAV